MLRADRQSALMLKITNDGLTSSGTAGCTHYGNSGRQSVKNLT